MHQNLYNGNSSIIVLSLILDKICSTANQDKSESNQPHRHQPSGQYKTDTPLLRRTIVDTKFNRDHRKFTQNHSLAVVR